MLPFVILTVGKQVSIDKIEVVIRSFAKLYYNLTKKHQKRLKLTLVVEPKSKKATLEYATKYQIVRAINLVDSHTNLSLNKVYEKASLMFQPVLHHTEQYIPDAFAYGLPVLTYNQTRLEKYIDNSCSMLIHQRSKEQDIDSFYEKLKMLYFDPEAQKFLKQGAKNKYRTTLEWRSVESRFKVAS